MKRIATCFLSGLLVFCVASIDLSAQATAEISGNVTDVTGARIPGADITATQTDTGLSRNVVSNETGFFTIPALPLGPIVWRLRFPGSRPMSKPASCSPSAVTPCSTSPSRWVR